MNSFAGVLDKINSLTPRERMILLALALAGVWAVMDATLLGPQQKARKVEEQRLQAAREKIIQAQETLTARAGRPDPDAAAGQRLAAARQAFNQRMQEATHMRDRMVAPKDMSRVLQGLMAQRPGLRLVSLTTGAPEPVGLAANAQARDAALFRHGVTLTLAGSYEALTQYMSALEKLPVGFYWARAELDASEHPVIKLTLTLHTLSLESTWLTVQ